MIIYSEGSTKAQEDEANAILDALTTAYPLYPWGVRVYEGGFFIRHLEFPSNWGMNCKVKGRVYSASSLKREVIMMAGEWLERAGLSRGANVNGDEIGWVEGIPDHYQAKEFKEPVKVDAVVESPLREEALPQVNG